MTTNTEAKQPAPTMAQVTQLETRCLDLEIEDDELGERAENLSREIEAIHVAGSGDKKKLGALMRERRAVKDEKADVLAAILLLRKRIDTSRELACTSEAEGRLAEIPGEYTALALRYEQDVAQLGDAATQYAEAGVNVHQMFGKIGLIRAERDGLLARFAGVAAPTLPPSVVVAPAQHQGVRTAAATVAAVGFAGHGHIAKATEKDEFALRTRRSYKEISGSPGFAIIKRAGWQAWPPLTEAQQKVLDGRQRDVQAEVRASKRFGVEGERGMARPGILGGAGGR